MSLSIGKSVVFHPHTAAIGVLGARIRVTTKMYSYTDNSPRRVWETRVVEATLRDISPPPPESSAGAFAIISSKDRYIFELNTTADYNKVTEELLLQYAKKMERHLAEYEADEQYITLLPQVREYADTAPTLHIEASASKHIIAEGDSLSVRVLNHQMMCELLGYITDIEIID